GPYGRLSRIVVEQSGLGGDVGNRSVAIVAQERHGVLPLVVQPRAAWNQYVDAAVVVVIDLDHIQTADNAFQAGLFRHAGKATVAVVVEVVELLLQTHVRDHDVEMPVIVEVLDDDAAGSPEGGEAARDSDVTEPADIVVRRKSLWRNQPLLRHLLRVRRE